MLGREILREIASSTYFYSIGGETSGLSKREQLVICIIWVYDTIGARQDVTCLHKLERADASIIIIFFKKLV